jgi:tetratricopeptide (TPR) repeat protein
MAVRQPDAHRAHWAGSLNTLANRLSELGRYEEALGTAAQAEAIYRELAARQPDAHRADWALSLANLAESNLRVDRPGDAASAAEGAVRLLTPLAEAFSNEQRAHLGFARRLLAQAWLGHVDGALAEARAAAGVLAGIFRARPAYAAEQYGKALAVLGRCEQFAGDNAAAVATLGQGLTALAPYFEQRPVVLAPVMQPLIDCLAEFDAGAASRFVPVALRAAVTAALAARGGKVQAHSVEEAAGATCRGD